MAAGTCAGVTNRIGAPLSAARPAAGIASAGEASAARTITWRGALPRSRVRSSCSTAAAVTAGEPMRSGRVGYPPGTAAEVPIRITCAPPRAGAPSGCIASSVWRLTAGRVSPSLYRIGAPAGALDSTEAASAPSQSRSSTSTTASGRVAGVRPGYTARATAAASAAASAPPRRVVLRVATLTAPWAVTGASFRVGPPPESCSDPLPQPQSPAMASTSTARSGRCPRMRMGPQ